MGAAAEHGLTVVNPSFHPYSRYFPSTARDLLCRFPARGHLPAPPGSRRILYEATRMTANSLYRLQQRGADVGLIRLRRDQHLDLNSEGFLEPVRRHRVVLVQDWFFRNGDNCARHRDAICAHLTPWEHHLARARAATESASKRRRFLVGVNIRHGDYRKFKGGRFF